LFDEVIFLGAFDAVLEYDAIGQGVLQAVDAKGRGDAVIFYLLAAELEIGLSIINAALEIAQLYLAVIKGLFPGDLEADGAPLAVYDLIILAGIAVLFISPALVFIICQERVFLIVGDRQPQAIGARYAQITLRQLLEQWTAGFPSPTGPSIPAPALRRRRPAQSSTQT